MTRSMHEEITIANLKGIDALMSILVKEDKPCTQFLRYGTESHRNNLSCLVVPEWLSLITGLDWLYWKGGQSVTFVSASTVA